MTTKKKKAEAPKEPVRKIYKDFTLDEFDVFAMDLQCEGAMHERGSIIDELENNKLKLISLATLLPKEDATGKGMLELAKAISFSVKVVRDMPNFEDRCGCRECGAI